MEKSMFISLIIEAVIFLIPLVTVFIKLGKTLQRIDELDKRVGDLSDIQVKLTQLDVKVDLLLNGKITNGQGKE